MNVDLEVKEPHTIQVEVPSLELVDPSAELADEAEEILTHINSSYTSTTTLPRGYANLTYSEGTSKDSHA